MNQQENIVLECLEIAITTFQRAPEQGFRFSEDSYSSSIHPSHASPEDINELGSKILCDALKKVLINWRPLDKSEFKQTATIEVSFHRNELMDCEVEVVHKQNNLDLHFDAEIDAADLTTDELVTLLSTKGHQLLQAISVRL